MILMKLLSSKCLEGGQKVIKGVLNLTKTLLSPNDYLRVSLKSQHFAVPRGYGIGLG